MVRGRRLVLVGALVGVMVGAGACSGNPADRALPGASPSGSPTATAVDPTALDSASPTPGSSDSPSGFDTASTPGAGSSPSDSSSAFPSSSLTPGSVASPATPGLQPSGATPASCDQITPTRVLATSEQPRRPTEVVTVSSDGRTVQSGTRSLTDFAEPNLTSPLNTALTDTPTLTTVANLVSGSGKIKILLNRPTPPDNAVDPDKRPFSQPGTYVLYNASALLNATVVVQCSGQEQNWTFTAESDPLTGQVNCAVEPKRSDALALSVYSSNC